MGIIKAVYVRNFKTYGPRGAKAILTHGVNLITGPNGSGKSNLVDAILFALGETNPRRLRWSKLADLIHKGGSGQAAAHVKIVVDNSDRKLPFDEDEVEFSREVRSSGASIYRVRRRRVSRDDYVSLLRLAGLHVGAFNVVPQGAIMRAQELTPQERLEVIADAIGLVVYDQQKAEALQDLQEAERRLQMELVRAEERRSVLKGLIANMIKAWRADAINETLPLFEGLLNTIKLSDVERELDKVARSIKATNARIEKLNVLASRAREKIKELSTRLPVGTTEEERELAQLRIEETRLRSEVAFLEEKVAGLRAERGRLLEELQAIKGRTKELASKLKELKSRISERAKEAGKLRREIKALEREKLQIYEKYKSKRDEELALKAKVAEGAASEMELIKVAVDLEASRRSLEARKSISVSELEAINLRLSEVEKRIERLKGELNKARTLAAELRKSIAEEARKRKQELRRAKKIFEEVSSTEKVYSEIRSKLSFSKARVEVLERRLYGSPDIERIKELGGIGAIKGYVGVVSELVKGEEDVLKLAAVACGRLWEAIVISKADYIHEVFDSLRKFGIRDATVLSLDSLRTELIPVPEELSEAVRLSELVECDYEEIKSGLFGNVLVVKTLRDALTASASGFSAITADGSTFVERGAVTTGVRLWVSRDVLARVREKLRALEDALAALKRMIEVRRRDASSALRSAVSRLVREVELRSEYARLREGVKVMRETLKAASSVKRSLLRRRAERKKSLRELEREIATLEEQKRELESKVAELRGIDQKLLEAKLAEELRRLEEEIEAVDELLRARREDLLRVEGEIRRLSSERELLLRELAELREKGRAKREELKSLGNEINEGAREVATRRAELREVVKRTEVLEGAVKRREKELRRIKTRLLSLQDKLAELEERRSALQSKLEKLRVLETRLREESERLRKVATTDVPIKLRREELEALVQELRAEASSIGATNPLAAKEYFDKFGSYKLLSTRCGELEKERDVILETIKRIEEEKNAAFMRAFNRINQEFSNLFAAVVPSGFATLELTNPENPSAGGIDIKVGFPEKPHVGVMSLSGAEKALVALIFLIAVQTIAPSSIFLFDEIDPHFDAVNMERYISLLRECAKKGQVIVVSLSRDALDAADNVVGVTFRNGMSRLYCLPKEVPVKVGRK